MKYFERPIFLVVFCVASVSGLDGRGLDKSSSTSQVNKIAILLSSPLSRLELHCVDIKM